WWDRQLAEITPLPVWHDIAKIYETGPEYDLWAVTSHSGMFAFSTVSNPLYLEASAEKLGHFHIQINSEAAEKRGIKDEDEIYIESAHGKVKGRAKLREGLRPDTVVIHGQFGHSTTPLSKDTRELIPNITALSKADIGMVAEDGGVRDTVKIKVYKATE
ncbi:molybdopterin dinucleotide binding domain-containing protein, partial [Chloroflexota bacterium]